MKEEKMESPYTPFNSFGTQSDDNFWIFLLVILIFTPNFANEFDKISSKELDKKVSKLEGKMEIIEKLLTRGE